jgi:hypothetical protein
MRKRFSRAFFAASASAVVMAGVGLGAGTASAVTHVKKDTVACGSSCDSLFSDELGSGLTMNAYVPGDTGVGGKQGQKVNLHVAANNRPNGDFVRDVNGQVFEFCGEDANDFFSPTSYICLNYPFFDVAEMEWSPGGFGSGLCAGVAAVTAGENVTLQPCGETNRTVWVLDRNQATLGTDCRTLVTPPVSPGDPGTNFCPWLNGGDSNFSDPLVLTLYTGTTHPTNQLKIARETLIDGSTQSTQLFALFGGPVT